MKPIILLFTLALVACQGSTSPSRVILPQGEWSEPTPLFDGSARMAAGDRLHAVANVGGAVVHRSSDDEGATWSETMVIPGTSGFNIPNYGPIAVEGATVHVLTRGDGNIRMWRSTDAGASWSAPTILGGFVSDNRDRVHVDTDGDYVHVFIGRAGVAPDESYKNFYWRSADRGATWSDVQVLDDATGAPSPGGIMAENGTVHIAYAAILPEGGELGHRARYIRSTDNGATWSAPVDVSGGSSNPQIRPRPVVADGRVLVIWEEPLDHDPELPLPNATRAQIRGNRSVDNGVTWQGTFDITAVSGRYPNHPIVAVGPGSLMHVAYRLSQDQATSVPADEVGYRLSADFGATWLSHEIAVDLPSAETHPYNAVTTAGFVHLMVGGGTFYHARRTLPELP